MQKILIAFAALTSTSTVWASPMPATGSSVFIAPHLGLFRSPLGFQISAGDSGWKQNESPGDNKFIAAIYKSPSEAGKGNGGSLTVRIDKLAKETPLDKYVQRWMKEYPKYGFDVLGSKPFAQNKERGYVLDLINRDNGRQLRQVVFVKRQKAVILTCRDQVAGFKESLKSCNQIIRTFQWVGEPPAQRVGEPPAQRVGEPATATATSTSAAPAAKSNVPDPSTQKPSQSL